MIDHQHYGKGIGIISDPISGQLCGVPEVPGTEIFLKFAWLRKSPALVDFGMVSWRKRPFCNDDRWLDAEHQQGALGGTFDARAHRLRVESKPLMSHLDCFRLRRIHELESPGRRGRPRHGRPSVSPGWQHCRCP